MPPLRRIAMWSGPRNISTAMMRSFENRPDTVVSDEPLYGAWLKATGADHPGREAIIAAMDCDWRRVTRSLVEDRPDRAPIWYQKHMAHHLLPDMDREWIAALEPVFLIRDPAEMIASYRNKRPLAHASELGLQVQLRLFEEAADRLGAPPPVIEASDVLTDPRRTLGLLCRRLSIPFYEEMLSWPAGRRVSDGVWAAHWYDSVERSTGFAPPRATPTPLEGRAADIEAECRPLYDALRRHRLEPDH